MVQRARSVLYVEDDPLVFRSVMFSLDHRDAIQHVESVRDARAWLTRARPRLIITDLLLPDGDGFEVLDAALAIGGGRPQAVVYTAYGSSSISARAALSNALFVEKRENAHIEVFRRAIERAHSSDLGTEHRKREVARGLAGGRGLTLKEADLLLLIAAGASRNEMLVELGVAPTTLKRHLESVFDKLEPVVRDRGMHAIEVWIAEEALYQSELDLQRHR